MDEYMTALHALVELVAAQQRDNRTLSDELTRCRDTLGRANETLRDLVQVVDPSLWHGGQANMTDLVARVRELVEA